MAGLLDFVAGFGVGALGGVAEQKKSNLEQKRQLNLAKLKAEYASDIETKRQERAIRERTEIANLQRTDPAAAQELAFISGIDMPTGPEPKFQTVQNFETGQAYTADINDPEVQAQIRNKTVGIVSQQTPAERFIERTDSDGSQILRDSQTEEEFIRVGREWRPIPTPSQDTGTGATSSAVSSTARDLTGEDFLEADITGSAPGITASYRRFISRIPFVAEIASDIPSDVQGKYGEQQAIANRLIARTKNRILSEEAQSIMGDGQSNRLTNMMLALAKQSANMEFGLFSTPQSLANDIKSNLIAINDELARQEELKDDIYVSEAARQKANTYINVFEPIAQDLQHMSDVHDVKDFVIGDKRLINFSKQEAMELGSRVQREREQGSVFLTKQQIEALGKLLRLYGE